MALTFSITSSFFKVLSKPKDKYPDELENVKQLNFSLQKFESDNIEFEKKCSDLHNSLQEEMCLKGVLLAKKQNLSNQLDSQ